VVDWLQCFRLFGLTDDLYSGLKNIADLIPNTREDAAVAFLMAAYVRRTLVYAVMINNRSDLKFSPSILTKEKLRCRS
jgi:hypothetical protein